MGWGYGLYQMKDRGTPNEKSNELVYWHKFDEIWNMRPFKADEDQKYKGIKMSKKDIEGLREIVCTEPDYWVIDGGDALGTTRMTGGFTTAELICEIAYQYDNLTEDGWEIIFMGS